MSSFLFTTIAAVVGVAVLAPSYATNIPTTNPGCTTGVLGADNIANGSAALEPDFNANTINTTWYSDGTQLTGNNVPGTCRYDAALTPPTPEARPGYAFAGWKTVDLSCSLSGKDTSVNGTGYRAPDFGWDSGVTSGAVNQSYTLSTTKAQDNWIVSFPYGDVVGSFVCTINNNNVETYGTAETLSNIADQNPMSDYASSYYCWCRVTKYIIKVNSETCTKTSDWVLINASQTTYGCNNKCASSCASALNTNSTFRAALYGAAE